MAIPNTRQYKIDHFRHNGRIVAEELELFRNPNWLAVLAGQEVWLQHDDPQVDLRRKVDTPRRLASLRQVVSKVAQAMPPISSTLNSLAGCSRSVQIGRYCQSVDPGSPLRSARDDGIFIRRHCSAGSPA